MVGVVLHATGADEVGAIEAAAGFGEDVGVGEFLTVLGS